MANTIPDIEVDYLDWTDVYTLTGIGVGSSVLITNKSSDSILIQEAPSKPSASDSNGKPLTTVSTGTYQATVSGTPSGIWLKAYSDNAKALVNVQEL